LKPPPFKYLRPATTADALELLDRHGGDAKLLAGGQSLIPLLRFRLTYFDSLIDIGRIGALRGLDVLPDGAARIGAMTTQSETENHPLMRERYPLLSEALQLVAHREIRNRGTIGGSLAHADPAAELPAVAVALDATLVSKSVAGTRLHEAEAFFRSFFTTALRDDEILTEVRFPRSAPGEGAAILETARRPGDFALVGAVARVRLERTRCESARLVLFGVGPSPTRAKEAEELLAGTSLSDSDIFEAARIAASPLDPISDVRASANYRRHAARALCSRAIALARDRARESMRKWPHGA
jgi:carbon-monoxide dehydrogenase medium subunit